MLNKSMLALVCMCGGLAFAQANAQPRSPEPNEKDMSMSSPQAMWLEDMCSENQRDSGLGDMMRDRTEHMSTMLELNPQQTAALKAVADTRMKGAKDFKASICAHKPDLSTFTGRLNFRVELMQHRLDAFKAEAGQLASFYNSLDAKQKAAFEEMGMDEDMRHERGGMEGGPND
jgi:hypothetical protein